MMIPHSVSSSWYPSFLSSRRTVSFVWRGCARSSGFRPTEPSFTLRDSMPPPRLQKQNMAPLVYKIVSFTVFRKSRPVSAGKMWAPLESRLPASLLSTMRPGSAAAVAGGVSAGDALAGGRGSVGTAGAGEATTIRCYPTGGEGGRAGSSGGGGGKGPGRRSTMSAQEWGLCGRKLSPTRVARSTRFIPR